MQANWIGRSEGVEIAFPYAQPTRAARARRRTARCKVFTTRADTLFGVTFMAVAAEHPLALAAARTDRAARGLHRRVPARQRDGSRHRHAGKEGHAHRPARAASLHRRADRGLGGELRAHGLRRRRGDGRAGARRARLRVRAAQWACRSRTVVRSGTPGAYDDRARAVDRRVRRARRDWWTPASSAALDFRRAAIDAIAAALEPHAASARSACSTACATGASRASATGAARSRSSIARSAATCPCRTRSCRCVLPEDLVPDGSGNPLAKTPSFLECACPKCGAARAARRTRWTRSSIRPGISCASPARTSDDAMVDERVELLDAGGSVHRRHRARHPAPAVRALLDARDARPRAGEARRAVREPAHAGHGAEPHLLPPARRRAQRSISIRPTSRRRASTPTARRRRGARCAATAVAVQYDGLGTMSKSKNNGVDPQRSSSSASARTRRGCS